MIIIMINMIIIIISPSLLPPNRRPSKSKLRLRRFFFNFKAHRCPSSPTSLYDNQRTKGYNHHRKEEENEKLFEFKSREVTVKM